VTNNGRTGYLIHKFASQRNSECLAFSSTQVPITIFNV